MFFLFFSPFFTLARNKGPESLSCWTLPGATILSSRKTDPKAILDPFHFTMLRLTTAVWPFRVSIFFPPHACPSCFFSASAFSLLPLTSPRPSLFFFFRCYARLHARAVNCRKKKWWGLSGDRANGHLSCQLNRLCSKKGNMHLGEKVTEHITTSSIIKSFCDFESSLSFQMNETTETPARHDGEQSLISNPFYSTRMVPYISRSHQPAEVEEEAEVNCYTLTLGFSDGG